MVKILHCAIEGDPTCDGNDYTDIPGLVLTFKTPLVATLALFFNLPQPYATGNNFPGGEFRFLYDKQPKLSGCFTYSKAQPESFARMPLTLIATIDVTPVVMHQVSVQWRGVRGSTVHLGGSASLNAIFGV